MNIRDAMTRINEIQAGLSITSPRTVLVKRVFPYFPDANKQISDSDCPCFINQWTAPQILFNSNLLRGDFTIHMQLLAKGSMPSLSDAADIATAFYPEIVTAFATNLKLGGMTSATVVGLRGAEPTLALLQYGRQPFVGLDLFLDLRLSRGQAMAA